MRKISRIVDGADSIRAALDRPVPACEPVRFSDPAACAEALDQLRDAGHTVRPQSLGAFVVFRVADSSRFEVVWPEVTRIVPNGGGRVIECPTPRAAAREAKRRHYPLGYRLEPL